MIKCTNHDEALHIAFRLFPYSTTLDHERSKNAGYPIYYATEDENAYICDLNSRIELNYPDGRTEHIHVEDERVTSIVRLKQLLEIFLIYGHLSMMVEDLILFKISHMLEI